MLVEGKQRTRVSVQGRESGVMNGNHSHWSSQQSRGVGCLPDDVGMIPTVTDEARMPRQWQIKEVSSEITDLRTESGSVAKAVLHVEWMTS